jgi:hypothetical protein
MLDPHTILEHAVEDFEGVAHKRYNAQPRSLFDLRRAQWVFTDPINDRANAPFERLGNPIPEYTPAIRGNFIKIGNSAV